MWTLTGQVLPQCGLMGEGHHHLGSLETPSLKVTACQLSARYQSVSPILGAQPYPPLRGPQTGPVGLGAWEDFPNSSTHPGDTAS